MRRLAVVITALAVGAWARPADAADHRNREDGLPTEVIDAYALDYWGRELQGRAEYRYTASGEHRLYLEPRFELGVPNNGQLSLRVPTFITFEDLPYDTDYDLGRTAVDFLYNFNQETLTVPAFALVLGIEAPDTRGGDVRSFDPFARLVMTKAIPGIYWHRIHLNGFVQPNVDVADGERRLRYLVGAGYDFRVSPIAIGLLDVVRDSPLQSESPSNFVQVGTRIQLHPLVALSLGGGGGITDSLRPVGRATLGIQWFPF